MPTPDELHDFMRRALAVQRAVDAQTPEPRAVFADAARELLTFIMANREKYLAAWIAETGIAPSEAMIVQRQMHDGAVQVTVERRPPDSMQGSVRQIADRLIALGSIWRSVGKDLYAALGLPLDDATVSAPDTRLKPYVAMHGQDPEQHRARHALLHDLLDELVADFCMHNRDRPSETPILSLMAWSSLQARNPTPTP